MDLEQRVAGIAALDQPMRRDLYRLLSVAEGWTTRDEAAEALAVPRSVAAFHLDKLVDAGLVDVKFERTSGRTGPGAGRPSKLYRPTNDEMSASIPERRYDLASSLLATAIANATETGAPVAACLSASARAAGREVGEQARATGGQLGRAGDRLRAVIEVLADHGYEPEVGKREEIALANCPFHRLAEEHRSLVCGMNLDFIEGVLAGMKPAGHLEARLAPEPGHCCVRIATR